ncbi:MAG TPA: formylglycine-generating enzyme family protein [Anaerolineaceae bacterium]
MQYPTPYVPAWMVTRWSKKLEEDTAITSEAASWAVEAWIQALSKKIISTNKPQDTDVYLSKLVFPPDTPPVVNERKQQEIKISITQEISMHFVQIPAGEFLMGSIVSIDKEAQFSEIPQSKIFLDDFWIGKYPVTNQQYQCFVQACKYRKPDHWFEGMIPAAKNNHPVVNVSWYDALEFCRWLTQITRLPIRLPGEAHWEKASRGIEGEIYPWGRSVPDSTRANYGNNNQNTTPIGRFSPAGDSPFGIADASGNVREWTSTLFAPYPYIASDGRESLQTNGMRVLRGGSWIDGRKDIRTAARMKNAQTQSDPYTGFRCAWTP